MINLEDINQIQLPTHKGFRNYFLIPLNITTLTIIDFVGQHKINHFFYWKCKCFCGKEIITSSNTLRDNCITSCGCKKIDRIRKLNKTHGLSYMVEYNVWKDMINRCYSIKNKYYHNYGGRGITVCDLWKNSFEDFVVDVGKRPSNKYSIDRVNVNGNYCFENCKWSTKKEQDRNRRNTNYIMYNGVKTTIVELAEEFNIDRTTLRTRIKKGWDLELALTKPVRKMNRKNKC